LAGEAGEGLVFFGSSDVIHYRRITPFIVFNPEETIKRQMNVGSGAMKRVQDVTVNSGSRCSAEEDY
jgi:hypothetical protein